MKKRFVFLFTSVLMVLALLMPAGATATSYGTIKNTSTTCKNGGNKVVATFKLHKDSGFYASKMTMTVYGQGYYGGKWKNEYFIGTWYVNVNSYGSYNWYETFYYIDNASGSSRINVIGKFKNGSHTIATGKAHSGFCG